MKKRSININKPVWEKNFEDMNRVYYHNVQSFEDKLEDIKADTVPLLADVMIFAETWLDPNIEDLSPQINEFSLSLNSVGRGRGLAIYYKISKFQITRTINCADIQITKLEGAKLTIIALYRSKGNTTIMDYVKELIPDCGNCLIIGDLNVCMQSQPANYIFEQLRQKNFTSLLCEATHLKGGHIDQAWYRGDTSNCDMKIYSPYYTCKDHDALLFTQHGLVTDKGIYKAIYYLLCNRCIERLSGG